MIRPTALVIWIPQVVEVFRLFFPRKVPHRLPASIWIFLLVVTVLSLIDCVVYRKPVLAFIRFIKFNFLEGQSAIFGQHHYMWYFYNGLPSIVGLSIIPLFLSLCMKKSLNHVREWNIIGGFILGFR
jgi:phosphatidylinositol glycan class B